MLGQKLSHLQFGIEPMLQLSDQLENHPIVENDRGVALLHLEATDVPNSRQGLEKLLGAGDPIASYHPSGGGHRATLVNNPQQMVEESGILGRIADLPVGVQMH